MVNILKSELVHEFMDVEIEWGLVHGISWI
jgi:hypothetical protein